MGKNPLMNEMSFRDYYNLSGTPVIYNEMELPLTDALRFSYSNAGGVLPDGRISRGTDYHNNIGYDKNYKVSYSYNHGETRERPPQWVIDLAASREKAFNEHNDIGEINYINLNDRGKPVFHAGYQYSKSGDIPVRNFDIGGRFGATDLNLNYTRVDDILKSYGIGVKGSYGENGDIYLKGSRDTLGNKQLMLLYGRKF